MPFLAAVAAGVVMFVVAPSLARAESAPNAGRQVPAERVTTPQPYWVAAHSATTLWSHAIPDASPGPTIPPWTVLFALPPQIDGRLLVWSPNDQGHGWVDADDVGRVDGSLAGSALLPPMGQRMLWAGHAVVTMYTCVELGGCDYTASGIWPEPGVIAVDPTVIPLGSIVWVQGLGTFLAADTGSLVRGPHVDVFGTSYAEALIWGVKHLPVIVFEGSPIRPGDSASSAVPR
jgi:3D (Asp-Asp-Asp) domain-containing protein